MNTAYLDVMVYGAFFALQLCVCGWLAGRLKRLHRNISSTKFKYWAIYALFGLSAVVVSGILEDVHLPVLVLKSLDVVCGGFVPILLLEEVSARNNKAHMVEQSSPESTPAIMAAVGANRKCLRSGSSASGYSTNLKESN